jgi:hypothetical protein
VEGPDVIGILVRGGHGVGVHVHEAGLLHTPYQEAASVQEVRAAPQRVGYVVAGHFRKSKYIFL